ncbi:MAG: glycerol kinase [Devosia sp. 67-54]|uniref:glycerol kinase GlpK n=1 Tax=unclassified Devosia TaxID=196773 RepID=UPI00095C6DD7|nr:MULTISPECIES: glycerol kinase GlpK [unclassified Devosia]MBN9306997.1 glycerol kinase GlpK [Devosia sp.]OJX16920.1 MAG: glycerol kinase [Devosia sp. 67-54]
MNGRYILAIDQGTSSTRAIIFDERQAIVAISQREFAQHFPLPGRVEHDLADIWNSVVVTSREALQRAGLTAVDLAAIGITNQRETVAVWDRSTSEPIHRAIVWQDRRTTEDCARLEAAGLGEVVRRKAGLLLDPYFSGTKIAWILDNVEGARTRAERGELAFGTIDSFLIWKLTGGRVHKTDATNASRTSLFDIMANRWDDELCAAFRVPRAVLPEVEDCAADFGETDEDFLGAPVLIRGVAGDQQAAALGQACFEPGSIKATYGTGCFLLLQTGSRAVASSHRLLTTVASRLDGKISYALEGSVFVAGAAVQWLRDGLGIIKSSSESGRLAAQADQSQDVVVVPAFTGLGAPYWDASARGAIFGLNRNSGPKELARATLEAVCLQTRDVVEAMAADYDFDPKDAGLKVDGGLAASDWAMQFQADLLGCHVDRPVITETTALGAAWLAAVSVGLWPGQQDYARSWRLERRFDGASDASGTERKYRRWKAAVEATRSFARHGTDG